MKKRENKKPDLESKKLIFFQIGLVIALLAVLYSFEYKSYEKYELSVFEDRFSDVPTEFMMPTKHKKPLPPPPKPKIKITIDLTDEADDNDVFIDAGANEETPIEDWEPTEEPEPPVIEDLPTFFPEEKPSFPGGYAAMMNFLHKNMVYPRLAKEVNITGIVYIEFVVEKNGTITNIRLLKEIGGGCDEEAVRVVNMMPKWNCGKQNGIPVRVRLTLPVRFSLL